MHTVVYIAAQCHVVRRVGVTCASCASHLPGAPRPPAQTPAMRTILPVCQCMNATHQPHLVNMFFEVCCRHRGITAVHLSLQYTGYLALTPCSAVQHHMGSCSNPLLHNNCLCMHTWCTHTEWPFLEACCTGFNPLLSTASGSAP